MSTIVITHFERLFPPRHGSARYTRHLAETLAAQGHECHIFTHFCDMSSNEICNSLELLPELVKNRWTGPQGDTAFTWQSVHYHGPQREAKRLKTALWRLVQGKHFDLAIVGDEYPAAARESLALLLSLGLVPVVYAVHTVHNLPFGPFSARQDPLLDDLLTCVAGFLTTSRFARDYIGGLRDKPVAILYPQVSKSLRGRMARQPQYGKILYVNPCRLKGIDIFADIVAALPHRRFAAVPGWGTTEEDKARLSTFHNVQLHDWVEDVRPYLARASLLLMPSIWQENFGMMALEAAATGLPVLTSDQGGLSEAALGVLSAIPVTPLEIRNLGLDNQVTLAREIDPWIEAIEKLLGAADTYASVSKRFADEAEAFLFRHGWERCDLFSELALQSRSSKKCL